MTVQRRHPEGFNVQRPSASGKRATASSEVGGRGPRKGWAAKQTLWVAVAGFQIAACAGYCFAAPPAITSVEVASFSTDNTTSIALPQTHIPSLTVRGTDFFPSSSGPLVTIRRAGFPDMQRIAGNINGGTSADGWITVRDVDLSAYPPGSFDVVVTRAPSNPGSATKQNAFSLLPHGPARLESRGAWGGPINNACVEDGQIILGSGRRLVVLDGSDDDNLVELGVIDLKTTVTDVEVSGGYAFVCTIDGWFGAVNIRDPVHPALVWNSESVVITGCPFCATKIEARNAEIEGSTAYVLTSSAIVRFDITDPAHPAYFPGVLWGAQTGVALFEVEGGVLYAIHNDNTLRIYDLAAAPSNPPLRASMPLAPPSGSVHPTKSLAVCRGMVMVTCRVSTSEASTYNFILVDATNPAAPVVRSTTPIPIGFQRRCALLPGLALLPEEEEFPQSPVDTCRGLLLYDISNPAAPTLLSTFKTHGSVYGVVTRPGKDGDRAYLFDHGEGLVALDITDPAHPVRRGNYLSPSTPRSMVAQREQGHDRLLYVSDQWNGFTVLNVADPARPVVAGVYQTPGTNMQDHSGIAYRDGLVYLAAGYGGVDVVDVSNPAAPVCMYNFSFDSIYQGATSVRTAGLELDGNVLRVGVEAVFPGYRTIQLWNLDAADPLSLAPLGYASVPNVPTKIQSVSGITYVIENGQGAAPIPVDNRNPAAPLALVVGGAVLGPANDFCRVGDLLYVCSAENRSIGSVDAIAVWNVADPSQPVPAGSFDQNGYLAGSSAGRYFSIAADEQRSQIFPVADLSAVTGAPLTSLSLLEPSGGGASPRPLRLAADLGEWIGGGSGASFFGGTSGLLVTPDRVYAADTNGGQASFTASGRSKAHGVVFVDRILPSAVPCPVDSNQDGQVTPIDIAVFINTWLAGLQGSEPGGDFDGNGAVEPADIAAFVSGWLTAVGDGGC